MSSPVRRGYSNTSLGQIHYREAGSGPPVLILHESPLSGAIYERALPILARRVRAISVDTPGYGDSDPPPEPLPISGYAQYLEQFLDTMELEGLALAGDHTGGAIAIQLAVDLPERIRALVVGGTLLLTDEEQDFLLTKYLEPMTLSSDGSHLTWAWKRLQAYLNPDALPEQLHHATVDFLRSGTKYDWGFRAAFEFETAEMLPKIKCPTLFMATKGDPFLAKNEDAVALTPRAEGRILDLPFQQLAANDPETYSMEVLGFLERVGYIS